MLRGISASIISGDWQNLEKQIEVLENTQLELIHFDIMDGTFSPHFTFGAPIVKKIKTKLFKDVHLMMDDPYYFIEEFVDAGANNISFHVESSSDTLKTIKRIKEFDIQCTLALNPETSVLVLEPYLSLIDNVLLMNVDPCEKSLPKMAFDKMREKADKVSSYKKGFQIDGGISLKNAKDFWKLGATSLVSGSALFKGDFAKNLDGLLDSCSGV